MRKVWRLADGKSGMNEQDLRVIKTDQCIEAAFLRVLCEKPYRAITVQDILDAAMINRSTFYRHYASKNALAEAMVGAFRQAYECFLTEHFNLSNRENLAEFLNKFLAFIYSQKYKILALWQIKTGYIDLETDMYELIKTQYVAHATRHQRPGNLPYQGHIYASLVRTNLIYCLQNDQEMTIEQLREELLLMMATASLQE